MNVALTRAESLLVVVGNPYIMGKDSFWSKWLEFCRAHGLWYNELPCGAESTQPDSTMIRALFKQINPFINRTGGCAPYISSKRHVLYNESWIEFDDRNIIRIGLLF